MSIRAATFTAIGLLGLRLVQVLAMPAGTVTLSLQQGARISDMVVVTARVEGFDDAGVRSVVFKINGQTVAEDTSIPYSFEWDTLSYPEGEHTIEAIATAMNGASARASVSVVVDNELAKGADHHGQVALEALKRRDREVAQRHALRALKLDPTNVAAARVLADIYESNRDYARAIETLERAKIADDDAAALRQLSRLYLLRAEADGTTDSFLAGLNAAYEQHRRLREALMSQAEKGTPAEKGDAAFALRNWRDAIIGYQRSGDIAELPLPLANRLLLAYTKALRWRDCDLFLRTLDRDNRSDLITRAVQGYYLLVSHRPAEARRLVQAGVDSQVLPALVVAAASDLVMGQTRRARELIETAARIAPDEPAVTYLQTFVTSEPLDLRRLITSGLAYDPTSPEFLLRKVQDVLSSKRESRFEEAERILDFARRVAPDSHEVLLTQAALLMLRRRPEEARPLIEQVLAQDKDAPDALVGLALNNSFLDRTREITDLLNRAMKIDEERWNDVFVPRPLDYLTRVLKYRIRPPMTPQLLYPSGG